MRRRRWLLVVGLVLVASGCSGTQVMGVGIRDDGAVEVRSYCTDDGLRDATIRTESGVVFGLIKATEREHRDVIVFPADALTAIEPDDVITVDGDYGSTGLLGESLTIRFGDLSAGTVVITGVDPEIVTLDEFEDRRTGCGFSTTSLALLVAFVIVGLAIATAVVAAPFVAVVFYLRRRRRTETTS